MINRDIEDWNITFADTGISSNIGQRLRAVRHYLEGEEEFLANYSDGLTDLPLPEQLDHFHQQGKIASFLCVRPNLSYHSVSLAHGNGNLVTDIHPIDNGSVLINGGFFIFKKEIFDYMRDKEELVIEPFHRLLVEKQLMAIRMRVSGPAWTPLRTGSTLRAYVRTVPLPGNCGRKSAHHYSLELHNGWQNAFGKPSKKRPVARQNTVSRGALR